MRTAFWGLAVLGLSVVACGSGDSSGAGQDGGTGSDSSLPDGGGSPDGTSTDGGKLPDGAPVDTGTDGSKADTGTDGSGGHAIKAIFLILMENHNWSDIKGSASAPYINNTLLTAGAHAENYFDNPKAVHPSEPNYIWLESGDNLGITDDSDPATNHQATTSHLVTLLTAAGVTWRSYQEDISGTDCPIVGTGNYAPKHNPMVFFDDIVGNPPSSTSAPCIANVRPYTQLAGDLSGNKVAQYNFITPNLCNDMHDSCPPTNDPIAQGDTWLSTEVPKILASSAYTNGGALFITWDESETGEFPIGMIVMSPLAKPAGYMNNIKYYHSSMLRTVEDVFSVTEIRDSANQPNLSDLFMTFP